MTGVNPTPGWAHQTGFFELGLTSGLEAADAADRLLIAERLARYCWGYDERRLDVLTECFTPDAIWEGSVMGTTPIGPMDGRDEVIRWLTEFWPHQRDQRRHVMTNCVVDQQTDDRAVAFTYLLLLSARDERVSLETTGAYRIALRREDGVWLIERMTAGFDAPFWPGKLEELSPRARRRHGVRDGAT
jgi:hypothetical protein